MVKYCEYGCGQEAIHQFKNGRWCCSKNTSKCSSIINEVFKKVRGIKHPHSEESKRKIGIKSKGRKHTEESKKKMSNSHKGIVTWNKGISHSEETKQKIGLKTKRAWKNINSKFYSPEYIIKKKERLLNGQAAYMNKFIKNPSKPEVMLREIVKELYPNCEYQYQVFNYSLDVAIPDLKIAIEYDGSYWHQDKEKDLKRQKEIEELGWKFIRYIDYIPNEEVLRNDILELI